MSTSPRQTLLLDRAWLFHLGDVDAPIANKHIAGYMANKAGWSRGAAKPSFDDSDWREVDLPHDWSIEGKFDPANHVNSGFLPRGIAWYRRHFALDEGDRGKYLALRFDGVATHCTVYVNGHLVHRNFCGYTPFTIDISDIANFGETLNCIAVRVDATYMEGWWYEGAGIYRHIWLTNAPKIHIAPDGVFVNPVRTTDANWHTQIETTIENTSDCAQRCELVSTIPKAHGSAVGPVTTTVEIPARSSTVVHQTIPISNPELWCCESPNLHQLQSEIRIDNATIDQRTTTFGYRTIRFDPSEGFFLNDKPVKLLGTCNHQDHAGVGVAVPDSIHEFRIRRLLEMGTNAYRCAHNPPAPEVLDACDRLGMLVMDENRNFGSTPEHLSQLQAMVLRDHNHPSVICWSICNEETLQGEPVGAKIARTMVDCVKRFDPSRPVTAAVSGGILNDDCIAAEIDVMSMNYQLHLHEPFHAKRPHIPIVAGETNCALSTRGVYETDPAKFVFGSYDADKAFWGNTARETWRAVRDRAFVAGIFIWTGFDYRGEPSPHEWPSVTSHWGILDLCGFAKDSFYLHKAWFTNEPFVHLLPHWNWAGREGEMIRVAAYTNCDSVELFLNGESLGTKPVDPIDMAQWSVPYQPGVLKAQAFRLGQVKAETTVQTANSATSLGLEIHPTIAPLAASRIDNADSLDSRSRKRQDKLSETKKGSGVFSGAEQKLKTPDPFFCPADGEFAMPITVFAADDAGRCVPTADARVEFTLTGPARILGVGNGDPNSHEPDKAPTGKAPARSLFNGLAQVILQTASQAGEIVLTASSAGLKSAELRLQSVAAPVRPMVAPARPRHLISDWRMSSITPDRPDPNQVIADTDMNSWERVNPSAGPQKAWIGKSGYAVYRATFTPPKALQSTGGRIVFHQIAGAVEVYLEGTCVTERASHASAPLEVRFPVSPEKLVLSVLIRGETNSPGVCAPVELLSL